MGQGVLVISPEPLEVGGGVQAFCAPSEVMWGVSKKLNYLDEEKFLKGWLTPQLGPIGRWKTASPVQGFARRAPGLARQQWRRQRTRW